MSSCGKPFMHPPEAMDMDFLMELLTYECPVSGKKRTAGKYDVDDQEQTEKSHGSIFHPFTKQTIKLIFLNPVQVPLGLFIVALGD